MTTKRHYPPSVRCTRCGYIGTHDAATCDRLYEALQALLRRSWAPRKEDPHG